MRRPFLLFGTLLCILTASAGLSALDELSGTIKQILDHRANDFASIRKDPHVAGDETDYMSTLMVAGAKECYITVVAKPRYSDSCDIFETKNRAILTAKYKKYVKALQDASPASWMSWTESTAKPASRIHLHWPRPRASRCRSALGPRRHEQRLVQPVRHVLCGWVHA